MENKKNIFNFLFIGMVLFSILFQAFHSYEHLLEQISKEICFHENKENQTNFTHAHTNIENCLVCHFSFSPFKTAEGYFSKLYKTEFSTNYIFFYSKVISILYKGSLFALRAPPTF